MVMPAAKVMSLETCPLNQPRPHIGGYVLLGSFDVFIEGLPAARLMDLVMCFGDPRTNFVASGSSSVAIDQKPAGRVTDKTFHGGLIVTGAATVFIGGDTVGGWTVAGVRDRLCKADPAFVSKLQSSPLKINVMAPGAGYMARRYDGKSWNDEFRPVMGFNPPGETNVTADQSEADAANSLYHEWYHADNGHSYTCANEYDTEKATEQWAIDHGEPEGRPGFRKKDSTGKTVVNDAAVKKFVEESCGPVVPRATPGGATPKQPDSVVGHNPANGKTIMERDDAGKTRYERPPKKDDEYRLPGTDVMNTQEVPKEWLTCP
jgi:uncharacterized Zn-binding protein involved in type VI secretion